MENDKINLMDKTCRTITCYRCRTEREVKNPHAAVTVWNEGHLNHDFRLFLLDEVQDKQSSEIGDTLICWNCHSSENVEAGGFCQRCLNQWADEETWEEGFGGNGLYTCRECKQWAINRWYSRMRIAGG